MKQTLHIQELCILSQMRDFKDTLEGWDFFMAMWSHYISRSDLEMQENQRTYIVYHHQ